MPLRRRRARNASDEDLSEGEESIPAFPQDDNNSVDGDDSEDCSEDFSSGDDAGYEEEQADIEHTRGVAKLVNVTELHHSSAQPVPTQLDITAEPGSETKNAENEEEESKKEKDPSFVPTLGRFFMHDDRAGAARRGVRPGIKKLWEEKDEGAWVHDKFEALHLEERPSRGRGFRRGRGRGLRDGRVNREQFQLEPKQIIPTQIEQGRGRVRKGAQDYTTQHYTTQQNTPQQYEPHQNTARGGEQNSLADFNRYTEPQTYTPQAALPNKATQKRYSSQREGAQLGSKPLARRDHFYDASSQSSSQGSYGLPYTAVPPVSYGYIPPPQYQYPTPYPYTSYVDPHGIPFAPVPYMPYYPVPVARDHTTFGREKGVETGTPGSKIWVPKYSKAIPITDPNHVQLNHVQPKQSKAIPITNPNDEQTASAKNNQPNVENSGAGIRSSVAVDTSAS